MKILMSGSGSGGHIYPCIALYNNLRKDNEVILLCFKEIDKKIYDLNNIQYIFINDEFSSIKKIKEIDKIYKNNNINKTITFGGKNSTFIQLISKRYKVDSYIFEQNVVLGKANLFNSFLVNMIFTNFKINHKKEVNVGNPNSFDIKTNKINLFNNNKPTLLFTMGSLGSSSTSKIIEKYIKNNEKYNIIYVSGNNVNSTLKDSSNLKIFKYYNPLTDLINISDIVITRAGASTLSELIYFNKPMIIIPSPYVANNHQEKNAKYLLKNKCCEMIFEKDLSLSNLTYKINSLTHNEKLYLDMKNNINKLKLNTNFSTLRKHMNI